MELKQIKGKTWALIGSCVQMLYRIDEKHCILFDTGYPKEREKLKRALGTHSLHLVAVCCTHAHIDHIGSAAYLQKTYEIPLYLSQAEGGILCSLLNTKAYRVAITPQETIQDMGDTIITDFTAIMPGTKTITLPLDIEIGVIESQGHSSGHLGYVTPDGVCFLGDALLSESQLGAKLPYALDVAGALSCHEKLKQLDHDLYLLSHFGTVEKSDFLPLIEQNMALFQGRAEEVFHILEEGKTMEKLTLDLCKFHQLSTRRAKRVYFYQRTLRFFLDYLEDSGKVEMVMGEDGIVYRPVK